MDLGYEIVKWLGVACLCSGTWLVSYRPACFYRLPLLLAGNVAFIYGYGIGELQILVLNVVLLLMLIHSTFKGR